MAYCSSSEGGGGGVKGVKPTNENTGFEESEITRITQE